MFGETTGARYAIGPVPKNVKLGKSMRTARAKSFQGVRNEKFAVTTIKSSLEEVGHIFVITMCAACALHQGNNCADHAIAILG